jgi:hypothetical protein
LRDRFGLRRHLTATAPVDYRFLSGGLMISCLGGKGGEWRLRNSTYPQGGDVH